MRKLFAIVLVVVGLAAFAFAFTALRRPKGQTHEAAKVVEESSGIAPASPTPASAINGSASPSPDVVDGAPAPDVK